ncbi:MAG TPA: 16S rRNA (cytosine(1402)-N(4))-methyltransferase [Firmicutes bacterium]|nr:16S rRNA (cytosine(1402)-N(4))-methyltransferase [Bacillota bacterium]
MAKEYNEHFPVMKDEVISLANIKSDSIVVDMTLGRAGHSSEFLKLIPNGHLYAVDQDINAISYSQRALKEIADNFTLFQAKFSQAPIILNDTYNVNGADFIFYDLGVSSPQFDDPGRGFSYRYNSPLDMRMDQINNMTTASEVVNRYEPSVLIKALYEYADEKYAKQIVKNIVKHRKIKPIKTTFELVDIIKEAVPLKEQHKDKHPAKKTFLAIRYLVNKEEDEILCGIPEGIRLLNSKGRLAVLTFNSYEDGLVKRLFKRFTSSICNNKYLPPEKKDIDFKLVLKKPLEPSEKEIELNHRSKPAKLRVIERIN